MDWQTFLTGGIGGLTGIISSYPFDTIKVIVQNHSVHHDQYKGVLHLFETTIGKGSLMKLYRGMASPVFGNMLVSSVLFGVEANARKLFNFGDEGVQKYKTLALSGAISGLGIFYRYFYLPVFFYRQFSYRYFPIAN